MPTPAIELPRALVNQILHHVQATPQQEACGLIGGKVGQPRSCHPVANIAATPDIRFRLDPKGQIDALRQIRESGEELFAIFHSHPAAPAEPSAHDLAEAAYPDALYLIISLNTKGVLEMRGFRISAEHSVEEVVLLLKAE
ncbi:MAG: Mov34/MPN/PAD-1 family protein [Candidatus Methylumidiphilus sp.]